MHRADQLLHQRGLAPSRTMAQRLIVAGKVECCVDGAWRTVGKPGNKLAAETPLRITDHSAMQYVSRGGLKLASALARSGMSVVDYEVLDVGQSTGGFTDCLLKAGASHVVGIDAGHGQLAPSLQHDPRVTCIEKVNARRLPEAIDASLLPENGFQRVVMDVSFISQSLVLAPVLSLTAPGAKLLTLVKPQFEVGREQVGKGGLVQDPRLHEQTRLKIIELYQSLGLRVDDYFDSTLCGNNGNREFFVFASRSG